MKSFAPVLFGLLVSTASAASFVKRQGTPADECLSMCMKGGLEESATECDITNKDDACYCKSSAYLDAWFDCLETNCQPGSLAEASEYMVMVCQNAGVPISAPGGASGGANATTSSGTLSASSTAVSSVTLPSAVSRSSPAPVGSSVPAVAPSATSAPAVTSRPAGSSAAAAASTSSSAWAMPTAAAGYMGAVIAAAGVAIAM